MNFPTNYDLDLIQLRHDEIHSEVARGRLGSSLSAEGPIHRHRGLRARLDHAVLRLSEGAQQRHTTPP
jgi:hypothetical protein